MFLSLPEAAQWLTERLGGVGVIGSEITESQLLRAGIAGHLLLCVPLDKRCYSPHATESGGGDVDAYGLYVVPPRTLFALETRESARLLMAIGLDRSWVFPCEEIQRSALRVLMAHLEDFASRVKLGGKDPAPAAQRKLTDAQGAEVRAALAKGASVKGLASKYGVSRRTIDKYKPTPSKAPRPRSASVQWPGGVTRHKAP